MKRITLPKVIAGLLALMVAGIGMDYLVPLLGPSRYLEISVPQVFYWIPVVLAAFVYCLIACRSFVPKQRRKGEYVARGSLLCLLCVIGFYIPTKYEERHVEFVPVSGGILKDDQNSQLERDLGFKVGLEIRYEGSRLFFERAPGRAEKVSEWLRQHLILTKTE